MYKQDKATTEKHALILRQLVKRPENKTCADCKRQDARWSSWNLGVFICIRCSGIHRSMGTHISKVKSVDLDTWMPEQMEFIQKWGNHRANLYWEARLRPGHVPPEHKIDSFIRSKYDSRRWAREGPLPSDPSILENAEEVPVVSDAPTNPAYVPDLPSPLVDSPAITSRQPQPHRLLSANLTNQPSVARQPVQVAPVQNAKSSESPKPNTQPQNDLFSLDFHAPSPATAQKQAPRKDVKDDILSLYSSTSPVAASVPLNGAFVQPNTQKDAFSQWTPTPTNPPPPQAQPISMMGTTGTSMWGAQSGWMPAAAQSQSDIWGGFQNGTVSTTAPVVQQQPSTQSLFETQNVWGAASGSGPSATGKSNDPFDSSLGSTTASTQKKDDAFGDLWGDFK